LCKESHVDLHIQFGYRLDAVAVDLIKAWGGGTVILSPKHQKHVSMMALSSQVRPYNGATLLDPQFYVFDPRKPHRNLRKHAYWPKSYTTETATGGAWLSFMLGELRSYNDTIRTAKYIIPGRYLQSADDVWFSQQEAIIKEASTYFAGKPCLASICVSEEALRNEAQIEAIVAEAEHWDVSGYYVVPEHVNDALLTTNPSWLGNLLILCAGLKLHG
jgi:hypothetical protein